MRIEFPHTGQRSDAERGPGANESREGLAVCKWRFAFGEVEDEILILWEKFVTINGTRIGINKSIIGSCCKTHVSAS